MAGLLLLSVAHGLPVFLAGWLVIGLGMGAGLYDPAFATLGRLYGEGGRSAITALMLFGGFASTVLDQGFHRLLHGRTRQSRSGEQAGPLRRIQR